jgi:glycosyltransferase involved in cell wall biosynthesis
MTKVSVIIPTHNRPQLLKRAVESVLRQTYSDWELLIVNDGDDEMLVKVFVSGLDSSKIVCLKTEKPGSGGSSARNIGIKNANSELVAFLDDDDEWTDDHLIEHVHAHDLFKEVAMVYNRVKVLNKNQEVINDKKIRLLGLQQPTEALLKRCFIFTVAMSMKTLIAREFLFDESLPKNQEWDLSIRVSQKYKVYGIDKTLTLVHMGESPQMGGIANIDNIIRGHKMLLDKHFQLYNIYPRSLAARYFELANLYKIKGDFTYSKKYFKLACKMHKYNTTYLYNWLLSLSGESVYNKLHKI